MTWSATGIVLLVDALYIAVIRSQGSEPPDAYTPPFVAAYLFVIACLLALSQVQRLGRTSRAGMRAAAAGGLCVLGIISLFSMGLPLVIAGALAAGATVRTLAPPRWNAPALIGVAAAFLSVAVLIGGFEVTERLIVCPELGTMTGSGAGFVTGGYHYECVNGVLSFHQGSCNGATTAVDSSGHVSYSGC